MKVAPLKRIRFNTCPAFAYRKLRIASCVSQAAYRKLRIAPKVSTAFNKCRLWGRETQPPTAQNYDTAKGETINEENTVIDTGCRDADVRIRLCAGIDPA